MSKFVTFEGIDGSGKSTISKKIYKELAKKNKEDVILTFEPTDTWLGETVNKCIDEKLDPLTTAFTFIADRVEHVKKIKSWLKEDKLVLCDRYADSTFAYQGAQLEKQMQKPIEWLKSLHKGFFIEPDLTFLFKLDVDEALSRIQDRSKLISFEKKSFLSRVQEKYLDLSKEKHFVIIDASKSIDRVVDECLKQIQK